MAMTNAEKQAALRARRAGAGLVLFQAWVTPEQAVLLKAVIGNQPQTEPAPQSASTAGIGPVAATAVPHRRRRKQDAAFVNNRSIISQHKVEIAARLRAGQKPSELAAWLQTFGFVGTGATFNGFWREV